MIRSKIKQRMDDLDLSQKEVAEYLGIYSQNLSQFLLGARTLPRQCLISLLEAIGLSIGYKEEGVGSIPPQRMFNALTEAVKASGMKRREMSEKAQVNASSISSFISGKRNLRLDSLSRLMEVLGMSLVAYGEPKILRYKSE